MRFNEQLLSQYGTVNQSGKVLSKDNEKSTYLNRSKDWIIFLLYVSILALLFSSFFYSGQILKKIEKKKDDIVKLKKTYDGIAMENEKIKILISELKANKVNSQKMIKILGDFYFREEAQKLKKQYLESTVNETSHVNYYYILIGIFLIAIIRFVYLEVSEKRAFQKVIRKQTTQTGLTKLGLRQNKDGLNPIESLKNFKL